MVANMPDRPARLLVVDDNPDVAGVVRLAVGKLPRKVEVVSELNAKRALDRLRDEHFDLVIADYRMRDMDGLEFLAQARPAEPGEQRFLFTAYSAMLDLNALSRARLDGIMEKPMMLGALREILDAVLAGEPSTLMALRRGLETRSGTNG